MLGGIYSHADVTKSSSCFLAATAHLFLATPPPAHTYPPAALSLSFCVCVCLSICIHGPNKKKMRLSPNVDGTEMLIGSMFCVINPCSLWVTVCMTTDEYFIVGVLLYVHLLHVAPRFFRKRIEPNNRPDIRSLRSPISPSYLLTFCYAVFKKRLTAALSAGAPFHHPPNPWLTILSLSSSPQ